MTIKEISCEKNFIDKNRHSYDFSSTKCELAKVMNRQAGLQELLAQRDDAIRFLEGRLDTSNLVDKNLSGKSG